MRESCCSLLFCSLLFSSVLFCSLLFSSVLFCSLLSCPLPYSPLTSYPPPCSPLLYYPLSCSPLIYYPLPCPPLLSSPHLYSTMWKSGWQWEGKEDHSPFPLSLPLTLTNTPPHTHTTTTFCTVPRADRSNIEVSRGCGEVKSVLGGTRAQGRAEQARKHGLRFVLARTCSLCTVHGTDQDGSRSSFCTRTGNPCVALSDDDGRESVQESSDTF